jgi:hypothetical protein
MQLKCTLRRRPDGYWTIRHDGRDAGEVEITATTREEAIAKMLEELRYRLEFCACVGDRYKDLQLELVESSDSGDDEARR